MAGATIFAMYQDGNGNVTISSRDGGPGHVEPQFDSAIFAGVELLDGSGVVDGVMRANVRCAYPFFAQTALRLSSGVLDLKGRRLIVSDEQVQHANSIRPQHPTLHPGSQLGCPPAPQ